MISSLQGKIILKKENFIILETSGVGFRLFCSNKVLKKISQIGENLKMFCYLDVGERSIKLYGFLAYEELEFFELMRGISGIGPKAALEISAIGPLERLRGEIEKGKTAIFESIPGIGRKKAQKIVLELSGKIKNILLEEKEEKKQQPEDKARQALINLGFSQQEATQALSKVPKEIQTTEQRVTRALKFLGRR